MTTITDREARVRRKAAHHDLAMRKSRRRDHTAGTYALVDITTNALVLGDGNTCHGFGCSLDDIEEYLDD